MVFNKYGVDFFLSDKLYQDPIEEHFGRIWGAGGASDNPTLEQYRYRNKKNHSRQIRVDSSGKGKYKRSRTREYPGWRKDPGKIVSDIVYTRITISPLIALLFLKGKCIHVYDRNFLW